MFRYVNFHFFQLIYDNLIIWQDMGSGLLLQCNWTIKTGRHDIDEKLLKLALNTNKHQYIYALDLYNSKDFFVNKVLVGVMGFNASCKNCTAISQFRVKKSTIKRQILVNYKVRPYHLIILQARTRTYVFMFVCLFQWCLTHFQFSFIMASSFYRDIAGVEKAPDLRQ